MLFCYQAWVITIPGEVSLGKKENELFILFSDTLSPQFAEMISASD